MGNEKMRRCPASAAGIQAPEGRGVPRWSVPVWKEGGEAWSVHGVERADVYYDLFNFAVLDPSGLPFPGWLRQFDGPDRPSPPLAQLLDRAGPEVEIRGTVACLASEFAYGNYYHWMLEVVPRLWLLERACLRFRPDCYLLPWGGLAYQKDVLRILGIPRRRVIHANRPVRVRCSCLVFTDHPRHHRHEGWMPRWPVEHLRNTFGGLGTDSADAPRRIYISRRDARAGRKVVNEDALLAALTARGFREVVLPRLTFAEQVALFRQAEVIVAPHGAGLLNTAFCRPGAEVVELHDRVYLNLCYQNMAGLLGLRHRALVQEAVPGPDPQWADMRVDVPGVLESVDALGRS